MPRPHGGPTLLLAGAVLAGVLATTGASALVATGEDPPPIAPFTGGTAAAAVVPVDGAGPVLDCPGSYLTTQDAGAAAPRTRP